MIDNQQTYVYTLAYPNGKVFYVGKGKGNRVFNHENEAKRMREVHNPKLDTIREIWASGNQVVRQKLAHFENEDQALFYELALLFFLPDLTNSVSRGYGADGHIPVFGREHSPNKDLRKEKSDMREEYQPSYRVRVKDVAESQGISQNKLSHLAVLDIKVIRQMYRYPSQSFTLQALDKVAQALDVSLIDLIEILPET